MRKTLLFSLLFVATAMFAATKVETFKPDDEAQTNTYCTTATSKTCDQATWEFLLGGTRANDVGNFGHWAAVFRAKKTSESVDCAYIKSSTIGGGIDSLWFQWNSNANETGNWRILIYINNQLIDSITDACGSKIPAGGPFNKFGHGGLQIEGDFTIRFENRTPYNGNSNAKRFVIDSLCWTTYGAPEKEDAELAFAENSVLKMIGADSFTNELTKKTDATPVLSSSAPEVATIDQDGQVTIVGLGTTVISAVVAETETYKADSVAYTLRVVPLNFHLETFDGAANITSGTGAYLTNDSVCPPSQATGIVWTTHLGSIRDGFGSWPAADTACAIRGKKAAEATYGYLLSDSIEGGIDSLAFDWNSNGDESARQHNWNIAIYINGDSVGAITDKPAAKQAAGHEFRYAIGNLKTEGKFVIKIVNLNDADDGTSNHYRWVMDNLEWFSYEAPVPPCEGEFGIMVDDTAYIAGVHNELQPDYLEYIIEAHLKADQTLVFYDNCNKASFLATQEEGCYWFTYDDVNNVFIAPAAGTYTIYLKMYGIDNNAIWTEFVADETGFENTGIKADVRKSIEDGMVIIYRNGKRYNLTGAEIR